MFCRIDIQKKETFTSHEFHSTAFKPFIYRDLVFTPSLDRNTGRIKSFTANISNMRLTYFHERGVVRLNNSLHKYIDGWNYRNLKYDKYRKGLERLSDETGVNWFEASFKSGEIALNYMDNLDISSVDLLYKNTPFVTPISLGSAHYQKKYNCTYFNLSYYDKYLETLKKCPTKSVRDVIPVGLKRFEVQCSKQYFRQIHKILGTDKVEDLFFDNNINLIKEKINRTISNVTFQNGYDYSKVSGTENLKLFGIAKDLQLLNKYKSEHPDGYKKNSKKIKQIIKLATYYNGRNIEDIFKEGWQNFLS